MKLPTVPRTAPSPGDPPSAVTFASLLRRNDMPAVNRLALEGIAGNRPGARLPMVLAVVWLLGCLVFIAFWQDRKPKPDVLAFFQVDTLLRFLPTLAGLLIVSLLLLLVRWLWQRITVIGMPDAISFTVTIDQDGLYQEEKALTTVYRWPAVGALRIDGDRLLAYMPDALLQFVGNLAEATPDQRRQIEAWIAWHGRGAGQGAATDLAPLPGRCADNLGPIHPRYEIVQRVEDVAAHLLCLTRLPAARLRILFQEVLPLLSLPLLLPPLLRLCHWVVDPFRPSAAELGARLVDRGLLEAPYSLAAFVGLAVLYGLCYRPLRRPLVNAAAARVHAADQPALVRIGMAERGLIVEQARMVRILFWSPDLRLQDTGRHWLLWLEKMVILALPKEGDQAETVASLVSQIEARRDSARPEKDTETRIPPAAPPPPVEG